MSGYTLTATVESVTPEKAEAFLRNGRRNRSVAETCVARYAKEILGGAWRLNHQAIALVNGDLVDGQHRCHAVVKAGVPIRALVVRYEGRVDLETLLSIDRGRARSLSDSMVFAGLDVKRDELAVAKQLLIPPGVSNDSTLSDQQQEKCWVKYADEIAFVSGRMGNAKGVRTSVVRSVVVRALVQPRQDVNRMGAFMDVMRTGRWVSDGDAAASLMRDYCLAGRVGGAIGEGRVEAVAKMQSAIRNFLLEKKVVVLRGTKGNEFPIDEDLAR